MLHDETRQSVVQHRSDLFQKAMESGLVQGIEEGTETWPCAPTPCLDILLIGAKELVGARRLFGTHSHVRMRILSAVCQTPRAEGTGTAAALDGETAIKIVEGLPAACAGTSCLQNLLFNMPPCLDDKALLLFHRNESFDLEGDFDDLMTFSRANLD
ncbi:MAG: hypothetical protein ACPIOQ_03595 [Promethearchaeia archaeon]